MVADVCVSKLKQYRQRYKMNQETPSGACYQTTDLTRTPGFTYIYLLGVYGAHTLLTYTAMHFFDSNIAYLHYRPQMQENIYQGQGWTQDLQGQCQCAN